MTAGPELDAWIAEIKSADALVFEGAYHAERPTGSLVIPRVLNEMRAADDGYTRGKFIELLGEMGDTAVVADLIAELTHSDQNVREWAVTALRTIGGEAAERAIQQYEATQPEEFA